MKIAILGGGFTGMTAAYYLAKKGHEVTLFEKERVLGGLAVGFKQPNWDWYLERAYHHLLDSEDDILDFAQELRFKEIFFKETQTSSLYEIPSKKTSEVLPLRSSTSEVENYRMFPVDTPQDFLRFPLLSLPEKIRAGIVLAFLKTSPFLSLYEKQTAREFLVNSMGKRVWEVLWQELFRKKFGKYAENILASFIWARIKKRAKKLGYIKGGFQTFINFVEKQLKSMRVNVLTGYEIQKIVKRGEAFQMEYAFPGHSGERSDSRIVVKDSLRFRTPARHAKQGVAGGSRNDGKTAKEKFDVVISTLPTVIMGKITQNIFQQSYLQRFSKLKYLHAVVLILETKQPILEKTYWLNVCTSKLPLMIVAQHTNFIEKKHYGGNNLAYVGWYVERENPLLKMSAKEVLNYCLPYLKKITSYELRVTSYYKFVGPFAQPIFDKDFLKNKPDFITPVKNFYIANLDMTYPYDRGTNYAVKLGREVSELIK